MLNLFQHPIIKVFDRPVCYIQIADQANVSVLWGPETSSDDIVQYCKLTTNNCQLNLGTRAGYPFIRLQALITGRYPLLSLVRSVRSLFVTML